MTFIAVSLTRNVPRIFYTVAGGITLAVSHLGLHYLQFWLLRKCGMNFFVFTSFTIGAIVTWLSSQNAQIISCRCRPGHACWPSESTFAELNSSVNGNLARIRPIGYVCHDPTYDQSACVEVQWLARNTGWRAAQAGILAFPHDKLNRIEANDVH